MQYMHLVMTVCRSHGLYRWHILDPIAFSEDIKVTLQQIGNDDLSLFERSDDVATVAYWYQDSAEGFDRHFRTEEHVCRGKNAGSYCSQVNM